MSGQQQERLEYLLTNYYAGNLPDEELEELSAFLQDARYDADMQWVLLQLSGNVEPDVSVDSAAVQLMIRRIQDVTQKDQAPLIRRRMLYFRAAAAAAVVLLIGIGTYLFYQHGTAPATMAQRYRNDVLPGGNKAVLTLADGSAIVLDEKKQGTVAQQGNMLVVQLDSGQLAYNGREQQGATQYNTLTTPRGGQYKLILPDGTKVWLNAGSSLRYPTAFRGNARNVVLKGEAYFEVTGNAAAPFKVTLDNDISVDVLGTHFNINAYQEDNAVVTTLLEGAVKVSRGQESSRLLPGQQASAGKQEQAVRILDHADLSAVIAWKEGLFLFNDTDIETIMKQLSRWYDLEIDYEGRPVKELFNGTIPRDVPVSKVLALLELTDLVHFKINGKKITVMP